VQRGRARLRVTGRQLAEESARARIRAGEAAHAPAHAAGDNAELRSGDEARWNRSLSSRQAGTPVAALTDYAYDANGNITAMPGITGIGWGVFDRMTQATANGSTTNYKYDAFGRRVAQETPNGTNWFFYDMSGRLLLRLETEPRLKSRQTVGRGGKERFPLGPAGRQRL
jgi:YD repeat-containing protein